MSVSISAADTSVTAFVGWTPTGATDRAVAVSNWADFERDFGALDARSLLGYAVWSFFLNGGTRAVIVRLDGADGSTAEPVTAAAVLAALPLLDRADSFNILCVPGLRDAAALQRLQQFCVTRPAFLIVDCAPTDTVWSLGAGLAGLTDDAAMNAAFYFPWITIADPLASNRLRHVPPCGFVAGVYARTDMNRGVWKAPAGTDALAGAQGVTVTLTELDLALLNPKGINCIRTLPARGTVVWGARTLQGDDALASEWKYVPVRRTALFLEESIGRGVTWAGFEPNDETLWSRLRSSVTDFMVDLFRRGAFQGTTAREAFFVKVDRETTTDEDVATGLVNIVVGFAPLRPAEFVVIKIQQVAGHRRPDGRP